MEKAKEKNTSWANSRLKFWADTAEQKIAPAQPWPYQFRLRAEELKLLFDFIEIKNVDRMLEIGCGNASGSILFSDKANKIVATDLFKFNLATSTIGLGCADRLIRSLNISNIALLAAQAERLPFADESFDLVFSAYVLEHLDNKGKAISEIKRVLKKDGVAIAIVPNFMERLYAPMHFYPYLLKRTVAYFLRRLGLFGARGASVPQDGMRQEEQNYLLPFTKRVKSFFKDFPNFPFCEPHGNYKCWRDEFTSHLPKNWKSLFEDNGLKVSCVYSTMFIPHNFLTIFSERLAYFVYAKSIFLTKRIGRSRLFKYLGYSICLVVQKR